MTPFVGACFPGFPSHSTTDAVGDTALCASSAFSAVKWSPRMVPASPGSRQSRQRFSRKESPPHGIPPAEVLQCVCFFSPLSPFPRTPPRIPSRRTRKGREWREEADALEHLRGGNAVRGGFLSGKPLATLTGPR